MKLLVTGGGGFIGKYLCSYLEQYYDLVIVYSPKSKAHESSNRIKLDLSNTEKCLNYFRKNHQDLKIQAVIHLASYLPSMKDIEDIEVLLTNIKITDTILQLSKLLKPGFILNFSSIAVYPNSSKIFKEDSTIRPSVNTECYYGLSKFCGENILDFGLRTSNIKVCHLRLAQTYGEGMNDTRLIPTMLTELRKYNRITVYGDGERTSVFINIDELKYVTRNLLEIMPEGIFNVGFHKLRYIDLANMLIEKYGNKKSKVITVSTGNRSKFSINTQKIIKIFERNNRALKLSEGLL